MGFVSFGLFHFLQLKKTAEALSAGKPYRCNTSINHFRVASCHIVVLQLLKGSVRGNNKKTSFLTLLALKMRLIKALASLKRFFFCILT
jgi:hypothetical protein